MEVNGIDPEIVGNQPASSVSHGAAGAGAGVSGAGGASGVQKPELDSPDSAAAHAAAAAAQNPHSTYPGTGASAQDLSGGVVDPHGNVSAQSVAAAATTLANQYAAAAAYGPPVPVQSGAGGPSAAEVSHARVGKRRVRLGWTDEETQNLMEGCKRHGVGNWKKILTDPSFNFNCRTAVDLKDRFRTSFPEEYSRLYPNARTHKVKRHTSSGAVPSLIKVSRKERRAFTADEDDRLLQGFMKHGPAWSKIQRDHTLGLGDRRSTDLRDRFRNAFPERYTAAGYKGRTSGTKASSISKAAQNSVGAGVGVGADGSVGAGQELQSMHGTIDDELAQQNMLANNRYMPGNMMQVPYSQQFSPQAAQFTSGQRAQAQQYTPQTQQYQQYPMQFYGMGMNAQMPMQMAGMQMRQMPMMNTGQIWPNQQQ